MADAGPMMSSIFEPRVQNLTRPPVCLHSDFFPPCSVFHSFLQSRTSEYRMDFTSAENSSSYQEILFHRPPSKLQFISSLQKVSADQT